MNDYRHFQTDGFLGFSDIIILIPDNLNFSCYKLLNNVI